MTTAAQAEPSLSIVFEAAGDIFAVDLNSIREVAEPLPLRPMPHCHPALLGLANLRGEVIGVVDLRVILGKPSPQKTGREIFLVFHTPQGTMAALVDRALATAELEFAAMPVQAEASLKTTSAYITRLCLYKGKFAPVLDLPRMLSDDTWRAVEKGIRAA